MWRPVGPALHYVLPRERVQLGRGEDDGVLRELRGVHVVPHRVPVPQHRLAASPRRIWSAVSEWIADGNAGAREYAVIARGEAPWRSPAGGDCFALRARNARLVYASSRLARGKRGARP